MDAQLLGPPTGPSCCCRCSAHPRASTTGARRPVANAHLALLVALILIQHERDWSSPMHDIYPGVLELLHGRNHLLWAPAPPWERPLRHLFFSSVSSCQYGALEMHVMLEARFSARGIRDSYKLGPNRKTQKSHRSHGRPLSTTTHEGYEGERRGRNQVSMKSDRCVLNDPSCPACEPGVTR